MDQDDNYRRAGPGQERGDRAASPPIAEIASSLRRSRNHGRAPAPVVEGEPKLGKRAGKLTWTRIDEVVPNPRNPRKHLRVQIRKLADSIDTFGFNAPILVDRHGNIIAGHGRYEAARLLGLKKVPVICLDHLTETQARAYMLADNKLSPEPELPPRNPDGHFVEMPPRGWPRASAAKFSGKQRPEFQNPAPHCFVGEVKAWICWKLGAGLTGPAA